MAAYTTTVGGSTATMEYEKALSTSDTLVITATPAVDVVKVKSVGGTVYGRRGSAPVSTARQTATDGSSITFGRPPGTPGLWTVHCLAGSGSTVTVSAEVDGSALGEAGGSSAGDGSITTAKLADDAVTFAKMQNIATDSLVGRDTAGSGDPESITLNSTLSMTGSGQLQRAALTGDVTAPAGSNTTTITNDAVTFAKLQNISSGYLIGRNSSGSGDPEEVDRSVKFVYTTTGTDTPTIPIWAKCYHIEAWGQGGGGGGGAKRPAGSATGGGGGGAGGGYARRVGLVSDLLALGSELNVVRAAGGGGGAGATVNSNSGAAGTAGGDVTISVGGSTVLFAPGGPAGAGSSGSTAAGGTAVTATAMNAGGNGGAAAIVSTGGNGSNGTQQGAGGGGGGGGIDAANVARAGGSGGAGAIFIDAVTTGGSGGATGVSGTAGAARLTGHAGGHGGGAGGGSTVGNAGAGGVGATPGGGGGGGGGARNDVGNGGNGGDGGAPVVIIIFW